MKLYGSELDCSFESIEDYVEFIIEFITKKSSASYLAQKMTVAVENIVYKIFEILETI